MRKISVINLKGGVGKTTTALNLAAGLSRSERKVLLIDFDPQSNVEMSINLTSSWTVSDFLFEGVALSECINSLGNNFDLVRGDERMMIANHESPEKMIDRLKLIGGYDYVLFDCGPSMNNLNKVALLFCNEAIIPTSTDYLGVESTKKMVDFMENFAKAQGHELKVSKIVPTLFDRRNKICINSLNELNNEFYQYMSNPIRLNSKLKEAPLNKKSIFAYARGSKGAQDYLDLTQAVLSDENLISSNVSVEEGFGEASMEEE